MLQANTRYEWKIPSDGDVNELGAIAIAGRGIASPSRYNQGKSWAFNTSPRKNCGLFHSYFPLVKIERRFARTPDYLYPTCLRCVLFQSFFEASLEYDDPSCEFGNQS